MRARRGACNRWRPLPLLMVLAAAVGADSPLPASAAASRQPRADETLAAAPVGVAGLSPPAAIGGLVTIPGNPLPPLPRESVENAIVIWEGMMTMLRPVLTPAARARGIGYLATLYAGTGDPQKAERLFDEAEGLLRRDGATGRDLGWLHNNRGLVRGRNGRYADALASFRAAVEALTLVRGEQPEPHAIVLQNLASAYAALGDLEQSETAFLAARDALLRMGKGSGTTFQGTSQNLAQLYVVMGDFAEAQQILEPLLAQRIASPYLRFAILNDLGYVLSSQRDFAAAEKRFQEARSLASPDSEERVLVTANLALSYAEAGDLERAQREGEEALALAIRVHGRGHDVTAGVEGSLGWIALRRGRLADAERLLTGAREVIGTRYLRSLGPLTGLDQALAIVADRRGNRARALEWARRALDLQAADLERVLAFGSEAQRLAYQRNAFPYDYLANLGDPTLLAEAVLHTKGAVIDSLLWERALARRSNDRRRLDRIHELKMAAMERTAGGGHRASSVDPATLERQLKDEETALARSVAMPQHERSGARPNLEQLQAALGAGEVLVELVRFHRFVEGGRLVPHYGALLIAPSGCPSWTVLGEVAAVDAAIAELVGHLDRRGRGVEPAAAPEWGEEGLTSRLTWLYERLWTPLAGALPANTDTVFLSPDGELHFVPWPCLLDERGALLGDRVRLLQLGSGRRLLAGEPPLRPATVLAFADGSGDLGYAQREVATLAAAARAQGWQSTIFVGEAATETELARHASPGILHFATHGGELDDRTAGAVGERLGRLPMYAGYLLLAGADRTFAALKRGATVPPVADGILTAEEVGALDLRDTWLTVLAACRSGAGQARSGEGVLGLRRGFALAGTRYLMFTLWSVDDHDTAAFMDGFYQRLFASVDAPVAFAESQRQELARVRGERGLEAAVAAAGAFVLSR